MGYYIRQLVHRIEPVPLELMRSALVAATPDADMRCVEGDPWSSFVIARAETELALVTRDSDSGPGSLVRDEVHEFVDELDNVRPENAAGWLKAWLKDVQTIYAFQILGSTQSDDDWNAIHSVRSAIATAAGGITQADGEGFSNEDGALVVWQFDDDVTGYWTVAVLDEAGNWQAFKMNLGDASHRAAFCSGKVPTGI